MGMKVKCLVCGAIYDFDEITFHLETFHSKEVEERGLWECFEFLGSATHELETLQTREWTDFPRGYRITQPQEPSVYELPYYGYIKRRKTKKGEAYYYCSLCGKQFEDVDKVVTHCLEAHPEHPDTYGVLKQRTKELILKQIREKQGSTEHISAEQLERYATEVLKERDIIRELTSIKETALNGFTTELFRRICEFVTRETDVCPLCAISIDHMTLSDRERFVTKQVLDSLKVGMKTLKKEDEKSFDKVVNRYYDAKILGEPVSLYLKAMLHLHVAHPNMLKTLVENKIIEGALPEFLAYERYKSTKVELSSRQDEAKTKLEEKIKEKAFHQWLKKRQY